MKKSILFVLFFIATTILQAQTINPENITIIRDTWGIPHVYANTDEEAVYGLMWAQCEDNFHDLQEIYLGVNGLLSSVEGKDGAMLDAIYFFVNAREIVEQKYETDVSEKFKTILTAYTEAVNKYAELYPDQVRHADVFPISNKDVLTSYVGAMAFMSNVHYDIIRIFEGTIIDQEAMDFTRGSNAWAVNHNFTATDETYLIANSHQPHSGSMSWYECHVISEEGWNFYGATLVGGVTPFIGTNENIGWTHTTNYDDFDDVYKLEMHPSDKLKYKFDGEWLELEKRVLQLKVKVGPIKLPIKRKFYQSVYGPTLKNDDGFYSIRFAANMNIKAAEQWYWMNKATDLEEFEEAIAIQGIPSQNILYADKEGNILKVGNALFPYRNPNPQYYWGGVLPGNTSETLWDTTFMPLDSLIYIKNPSCGYLYNMNNTSYSCTCPEENPNPEDYNHTIGYQPKETARSDRFMKIIQNYDELSYEDLKEVKYDNQMTIPFYTRSFENIDVLRNLDETQYPELADVIQILKAWDGSTTIDSKGASVMSLAITHLIEYSQAQGILDYNRTIEEQIYIDALTHAKAHLLKHFGTVDVALGDLQFLVRGDKSVPIWGLPDVITAMYTSEWKDGLFKNQHGESYILFVTYNNEGVAKMEAINVFGSSNRPDSPHYDDQMEMFVNQELREVYFEKDDVKQNFETVYHPK